MNKLHGFDESILYEDQAQIIAETRLSMRSFKTNLIRAETGSGKTIISVAIVAAAMNKGTKSLFVVPRRELLKQTSNTYEGFSIPHSYVSNSRPYNPFSTAYIATARSLINRIKKGTAPDVKIVILDETHYSFDECLLIANYYIAKGAWVIGLTATPVRTDGRGLGRLYQNMINGPSVRYLIDNKRLSEYRLFQPSIPDLSNIRKTGNDYSQSQIDERMRSDNVLIKGAVNRYRDKAMGMLNKAFCTSIDHSEQVAGMFRDAGIPAAHISSKTPDDELKRIIKAFARREILTLASCDLCTFGFDLAAAAQMDVTIECMTDLQPTLSKSKQRQKNGRVLRYKDFAAIFFDNAGNTFSIDGTKKHGFPDDDIEWSLEDGETKKQSGDRSPPSRQCLNCFAITKPAPICPECGHVHEIKSREIDEIDGDLVELSKEQREALRQEKIKERKTEQGRAQSLEDLIALGKRKGYGARSTAWAAKIMAARLKKKKHGN